MFHPVMKLPLISLFVLVCYDTSSFKFAIYE